MKKLKLIFATLLSVLFAFTGGKAFADDSTYTLTLNGTTTGHTYEVYQIFAGDVSSDGTTLSNITWGSGVVESGFEFKGSSDAATIAESLSSEDDDSATAQSFATTAAANLGTATATVSSTTTTTTISGLAAGYYLVKDADNSQSGENSSYTRFILKVVGNAEADLKSDVPSVVKKVQDTNDTTGETSDWQDSADYDINDSVPFQLTATLPSNLDDYTEYYLEFSDTLSDGLTYNGDAKVYLVNGDDKTNVTSSFTVDTTDGLSFKINNLKGIEKDDDGNEVTIDSSTKVVVEYTATLNENAVIGSEGNPNTVKLIYSNNPNYTGSGETPEDTVIVFTYKVVVNKVKEDGTSPLEGAGFTLYKKDSSGKWNEVETISAGDTTTFTFSGLDDGDYKLVETTVPDGYNKASDVEFTVTAKHDEDSETPKLTELTGDVTTGSLEFTSSTTDGSLTTDVVNKKGSVLPSTGGMGTTILYVVGTILVLAAGILLVTKKRMDAK
ncbi:LPXTG-motif cell wall anchor domain-containing protein/fimbrial isopeptide formation D2 domain-containing protein [Streptococcus gallolyticus]|uniref:LPXTG-motif cell wall anchor domain-containing protein/fimbrial isopeptide formation D2 domain-containing protein n=1 Tax=Streptococcus gallolyticus TaxID=315405 RepID=A0A1I7II48_9STRE|nr:isopeptide-forming domain-containing fimbrial protein [Streptococcus gallolyticus]SFC71655.1 LPXTG-motif cell wall anchor domain-containing protein/fimbrial isopeptide formation D2 domain-containing protein [Streptococcus gallolyticus]SFU72597.1 LPXTG-motif cell wall anchor domain-containing protein/fimbrial isopeptide formation D2 domain-containing protein [Streptococcus gallolyticus]